MNHETTQEEDANRSADGLGEVTETSRMPRKTFGARQRESKREERIVSVGADDRST